MCRRAGAVGSGKDLRDELDRLSRKVVLGCYLPYLRGHSGSLYCTFCIDAALIPAGCNGKCDGLHHTCPYPHYCPCQQRPSQERLDDFCERMETSLEDAMVPNDL